MITNFDKTIVVDNKSKQDVVVIIPFYNGSEFICRALNSVFLQTIPASEVIVVNDGSTASETEFLIELTKEYSITLIHKENGGQGSARNLGVQKSKSPYICFLDQDDFYLPNHIEILLKAIPQDALDLGVVYGDLYEADGNANIIRMGMVKSHSIHPKRDIVNLISQDMFILPSASLIVRKVFEAIGGFDTQFKGYEDDDFFLRMFRAGYSNHFVDKPVTVWCIHPASTSYSVHMSRSRFNYLCKLIDFYPDNKIQNRFYFRDLILPRFASSIIRDTVEAKISSNVNTLELIDIFNNFKKIVLANKSVSVRYKIKLILIDFVLGLSPKLVGFIVELSRFLIPLRKIVNF